MLVGRDTSDSDFNTILKTGGEKTHKLSVDELARHGHSVKDTGTGWAVGSPSDKKGDPWGVAGYGQGTDATQGYNFLTAGENGNNQPHNNLQPYIVVYRWRRIA